MLQGMKTTCPICLKQVSNLNKHKRTHKEVAPKELIFTMSGIPSSHLMSGTQLLLGSTGPLESIPASQILTALPSQSGLPTQFRVNSTHLVSNTGHLVSNSVPPVSNSSQPQQVLTIPANIFNVHPKQMITGVSCQSTTLPTQILTSHSSILGTQSTSLGATSVLTSPTSSLVNSSPIKLIMNGATQFITNVTLQVVKNVTNPSSHILAQPLAQSVNYSSTDVETHQLKQKLTNPSKAIVTCPSTQILSNTTSVQGLNTTSLFDSDAAMMIVTQPVTQLGTLVNTPVSTGELGTISMSLVDQISIQEVTSSDAKERSNGKNQSSHIDKSVEISTITSVDESCYMEKKTDLHELACSSSNVPISPCTDIKGITDSQLKTSPLVQKTTTPCSSFANIALVSSPVSRLAGSTCKLTSSLTNKTTCTTTMLVSTPSTFTTGLVLQSPHSLNIINTAERLEFSSPANAFSGLVESNTNQSIQKASDQLGPMAEIAVDLDLVKEEKEEEDIKLFL